MLDYQRSKSYGSCLIQRCRFSNKCIYRRSTPS